LRRQIAEVHQGASRLEFVHSPGLVGSSAPVGIAVLADEPALA